MQARYPMARRGGLFRVLIGAGLVAAIALGRDTLVSYPVFFAGLGLAVLSLFASDRLSAGTPTRAQRLALAVALAIEAVLFTLLPRVLPPGTSEHVRLRRRRPQGLRRRRLAPSAARERDAAGLTRVLECC